MRNSGLQCMLALVAGTVARYMTWSCLLVLLGCLSGCQKDVMIRVANRSDVLMSNVVVKFPSQTETYGDIAPGSATDYRKVNRAYPYAYVEAVVSGNQAILQPIDYVGERLLAGGNYTYELTHNPRASDKYGRLELHMKKE